VLWVRQLGLLVGGTARAAALAIAIFFAGLALGGRWLAGRAARLRSPLATFGWLELGVAAAASSHLVLLEVHRAVEPVLLGWFGSSAIADTAMIGLVATSLLLPPSVLMGATLPAIAEHVVRRPDQLATTGSLLYAVNTAGGAAGALAAGFALPLALGVDGAYLAAIATDVAVGLAALGLARWGGTVARPRDDTLPARTRDADPGSAASPSPRGLGTVLVVVAGASGAATIGTEVVWTRLFAQVLQNSAATYALVLSAFLAALALGAATANVLARGRASPSGVLTALLLAAGTVTATSAWLFDRVTGGLGYLGGDLGWAGYALAVTGTAAIVVVLPGTLLGAVFPFLLRLAQERTRSAGETVGRLVAANTCGAIAGSLVTGFVLLPMLGATRALWWLAAVYPATVVVVLRAAGTTRRPATRQVSVALTAVVTALLLFVPPPLHTVVRLPSPADRLVAVTEGAAATVAVVERDGDRRLRVDNHYTLGGTRAAVTERDQALIPLLLHPEPRSVFFLGLGTGITAGAAVGTDVERIDVCELVPEVVTLAAAHFRPWTDGLFDDPRVRIQAQDGRTCLRRASSPYDLVVADLFTPWKAGTGNLYTREHFEVARDRLAPGGRFVQWLPLYQLSEVELASIARSMQDVFPLVTAWRGDLFGERSVLALVGHEDPAPLDPGKLAPRARAVLRTGHSDAALEALLLRLYVGNLSAGGTFAEARPNTDARPLVEHLAPRTHRAVAAGHATFLTGAAREALYDRVRAAAPPAVDPYLARLDDRQRGYVDAGHAASRAAYLHAVGDPAATRWERRFRAGSPAGSSDALTPARLAPLRRQAAARS
jgi:spermidine synthase